MTTSPPQVNGHPRTLPVLGEWQAITKAIEQPVAAETANGPTEPKLDLIAEAEAEAIRARAAAESEARRKAAEAEAEAVRIKAEAEAEKQRLANERAAMKLEADKATHAKRLAELDAQKAAAEAAALKARKVSEVEAGRAAAREAEQKRTEHIWKWGARAIYAVGLIIASPIQFLAFWDKERPFLVAAPALLEGLALVLAFGAAWAVAHRRDVLPYRVGIMVGALIAAGINLWHGLDDPEIGLNAGIIGAIASVGGPIVLMAYEHGIAQKADGVPSWREQRAADKAREAEEAVKSQAKAEKEAAEGKAAADKAEQQARLEAEQQRKDADRRDQHKDVWDVAEAFRSARGAQVVTEQIWADAWYRVTGTKLIGIRPEIEAQSRLAAARMKDASECPVGDAASQVESQMPPRQKKDQDAPDGRRHNGGIPPIRQPGDTTPYHRAAAVSAADTARRSVTARITAEEN
ncbi:hypothetical protein AB0B51_27785 [Streptomyces griseus]|uniref:hypothetical protein n=1 Tax=Streptomyces griseus TaxID=1911 RepID=UPI0004CB7F4B|nr:hypothetical protein [Streptomyces griseus]